MDIDDALDRAGLPDVDPDVDDALAQVTTQVRRTRRRRAVTGGGIVVVLVVVAALAIGPGDDADQVDVAADQATTTSGTVGATSSTSRPDGGSSVPGPPQPGDDRWEPYTMAAGGWNGARSSPDGRALVVAFTSGAPYREDDQCSVAHHAEAEEGDDTVVIQLFRTSPRSPDGGPAVCRAIGYDRSVVVELTEPLGGRTVVEEGTGRMLAVFDGALLAEPAWLPEGWALRQEQARWGEESGRSWMQTWGVEPPAPTGDRCTPSEAPISLIQQLTSVPQDLGGMGPLSTHELRGTVATYHADRGSAGGAAALTWTEAGQSLALWSAPSCDGEDAASLDRLLRFARELTVPEA